MLHSAAGADVGSSSPKSSESEGSRRAALETAKKEMEKAERGHAHYLKNAEEATSSGMALWHSEYDNWLDLHSKRQKIESNAKRHALVSRIVKDEHRMASDVLHEKSEEIKRKSNEIKKHIDQTKKKVKYDPNLHVTRLSQHSKRLKDHESTMAKYKEIIRKNSK